LAEGKRRNNFETQLLNQVKYLNWAN
jgi:hypothetical protein